MKFRDLTKGDFFLKNPPFEGTINWAIITTELWKKTGESTAVCLGDGRTASPPSDLAVKQVSFDYKLMFRAIIPHM